MYDDDGLDKRYDWVGPANRVSNIRPIKLRILKNESKWETDYRLARESLNNWNCKFWSEHNQLFETRKAEYYAKKKREIGRLEHVTASDLSEFYKTFLNEQAPVFSAYNNEWYSRNFKLIWPALRVNLIRFRRFLSRF